ncbi:MAG: site-specific integrase [Candidatus Anstonellales archaeon]
MDPQTDIHNYDRKYEKAKENLNNSKISFHNKELILKFDNLCLIEGISKPRRIRLIGSLRLIAEKMNKDFDKATKEDLKKIVAEIEERKDYSPWTKHSYKIILKKFYKWLKFGDNYKEHTEYPEIVRWIKSSIKKKEQPKVQASDILTEDEVKKLIDVAEHPRDKAFISLLYELGARISEIGNLKIKDISKDKYSFIVDIVGKTGHRTPRVVFSSPHLTAWLNIHPLRNNPNSPLWVLHGTTKEKMDYSAYRALVKRLAKKAKIKKRIYPHLFRHTRVTHLLANKMINEAQAKVYFGWIPSSKMLSEYSHLISADVNETILKIHGIKNIEEKDTKLKVKQCPRCQAINESENLFCGKCSSILDIKTAIEMDEKRKASDDILTKVLSILAQDEKIREIIRRKIRKESFIRKIEENFS